MDWFRWHHGSVTDPKFGLVARKSGASLPDVLAVWAYILEAASQSVERGDFGTVDCEALDCLFNFPGTENRTSDILKAMAARGLIAGSRIAKWEERQPKREREDNTNASRQANFKAKKNQVTPDNANDDQKTPREDKSREDKKEDSVPDGTGASPPNLPTDDQVGKDSAEKHKTPAELEKSRLWAWVKTRMVEQGSSADVKAAGVLAGKLASKYGGDVFIEALRQGEIADPGDVHTYVVALCELAAGKRVPLTKPGSHTGFQTKNYREGVAEDGSFS
jgi:hypothetical protein